MLHLLLWHRAGDSDFSVAGFSVRKTNYLNNSLFTANNPGKLYELEAIYTLIPWAFAAPLFVGNVKKKKSWDGGKTFLTTSMVHIFLSSPGKATMTIWWHSSKISPYLEMVLQVPTSFKALTGVQHIGFLCFCRFVVVVRSLSCVWLFLTPWTAARQISLSFTIFRSSLKLISHELVTPSYHLFHCCPFLLLPSIFPSIRVFSKESALRIRWPKYWSFSICPSSEYSGLISFRID